MTTPEITPRILRPGLLVSLSSTVTGGIQYQREDKDAHTTSEGAAVRTWETTAIVDDPEERARAIKVRAAARARITGICAASDFGLLCPTDRERLLSERIGEARALADEFNRTARTCKVTIYMVTGRIAVDDVEATRAIGSEIRGLVRDMERGIKSADPGAIREAANKARALGAMLSDETGRKVNAAVEEARAAARAIVKRIDEAGSAAAVVVEDLKVEALTSARFAFLDLDGSAEIVPTPPTAVDVPTGKPGVPPPATPAPAASAPPPPVLDLF